LLQQKNQELAESIRGKGRGGAGLNCEKAAFEVVDTVVVAAQPPRTPLGRAACVGTPDYLSGIPDMHTIHDPMISVS
jgi:hypothetical protein